MACTGCPDLSVQKELKIVYEYTFVGKYLEPAIGAVQLICIHTEKNNTVDWK